eukprot:10858463-Lingulodinium_polyedra.AAC.1
MAAEAAAFDLSWLAHREGRRRGKVERFLLRSLRDRSLLAYLQALERFKFELEELHEDWHALGEEQRDWLIADLIVTACEEETGTPAAFGLLLAALQK